MDHFKRSKIGILTYTSNMNMGTFLQAMAMKESIQLASPESDVSIIPLLSESKQRENKFGKLPLKPSHLYFPSYFRDRTRVRKYIQCQEDILRLNHNDALHTDSYKESCHYINELDYDVIVVGSDACLKFYQWNFQEDKLPIFWLPQQIKSPHYMIGPSIGTTLTLDNLETHQKNQLQESIQGFNGIAVRDQLTKDFIIDLVPNAEVTIIPDPTFSLCIDTFEINRYIEEKKIPSDQRLIGIDVPMPTPHLKGLITVSYTHLTLPTKRIV